MTAGGRSSNRLNELKTGQRGLLLLFALLFLPPELALMFLLGDEFEGRGDEDDNGEEEVMDLRRLENFEWTTEISFEG